MIPGDVPPQFDFSSEELKNIELVREFMRICYDPHRASVQAVAHLCDENNRFAAWSTLPELQTLGDFADYHAKLTKKIDNLHFVSFDVLFAKGDWVCLRYTAEGTHSGEPHGDIQPTHRRAIWSATGIFRIRNGKLVEFNKDWNKLAMWEQLGWPIEECLITPPHKRQVA